jgi:hypothetical protein
LPEEKPAMTKPNHNALILAACVALASPYSALAQEIYGGLNGFRVRFANHSILIARGTKATDYVFTRKATPSSREKPVTELNKWFQLWNHTHLAFSPNGHWAAWRDTDNLLIAVSLDGRMKRVIWEARSDEHDPIVWLPDSSRLLIFRDYSEDPKGSDHWRRHDAIVFNVKKPHSLKELTLPETLAKELDNESEPEETVLSRVARKLVH